MKCYLYCHSFNVVLYILARTWKQTLMYSSIEEWIRKWCVYTKRILLTKRNDITPFAKYYGWT